MSNKELGVADEAIIRIKAPLPFPLRWVNSYIIRGEAGLAIVDPGLHTAETEQVWEEAFTHHGLRFADVEQIVLTHHHPDHYGMAGWFQEHSGGAPVWISRTGYEQVQRLWGSGQPLAAEIAALFLRHGMGQTLVEEQLIPHMAGFVALVSPQPEVSFIPLDRPFRLGDRFYEPIVTPGHAAGHICFYDKLRRIMFCGDHVLPQISPNISYLPGVDDNPLHSFMASLEALLPLEVSYAYPGHRDPFTGFNQRVAELIEHHRSRLVKLLGLLQQPRHAYGLCLSFFGDHLPIHQMRFAMAETLAHVIYLHQAGSIVEEVREGICYYSIRESRGT